MTEPKPDIVKVMIGLGYGFKMSGRFPIMLWKQRVVKQGDREVLESPEDAMANPQIQLDDEQVRQIHDQARTDQDVVDMILMIQQHGRIFSPEELRIMEIEKRSEQRIRELEARHAKQIQDLEERLTTTKPSKKHQAASE